MKQTKYLYTKVIQQYYAVGYGWEDVSEYDCNSQGKVPKDSCFRADLKEYRTLGYVTRVVTRKTLRPCTV